MRQRTWWQKSRTRWCWSWCSPQVHRLTFHDNTQLIRLHANKANNDPNTTRRTVGNGSMWKKLKTKSDRNGTNWFISTQKEKNFQSFRSLCCLTDDNSDSFQNCWSQQQGKNTMFVWQQFPPHTSAETSIRLKLCSCAAVPQSTCWLCLHPGCCFLTSCDLPQPVFWYFPTIPAGFGGTLYPSRTDALPSCGSSDATRLMAWVAVVVAPFFLKTHRKDSSRGSCLSVWNCN